MLPDVAASMTLKYIIYPRIYVFHFEQYCILSLLAGIPHTKGRLFFFPIPLHLAKIMQHNFGHKEPGICFEVLKLQTNTLPPPTKTKANPKQTKPTKKQQQKTPQATQFVILTLTKHVYAILLLQSCGSLLWFFFFL